MTFDEFLKTINNANYTLKAVDSSVEFLLGKDGKKRIQNELTNLILEGIKSIKKLPVEVSGSITGLGTGLAIAGAGPFGLAILGIGAIITLVQYQSGTFHQTEKIVQCAEYCIEQDFFTSGKYYRLKELINKIDKTLKLQGNLEIC